MLDAIFQSLAVFFISLGAFSGSDMGLWEFGTLLCSQCILVMLIQCGVETKSWTVVHWASILISVGLYLAFGLIYNGVCSQCAGLTNPYLVMQVRTATGETGHCSLILNSRIDLNEKKKNNNTILNIG